MFPLLLFLKLTFFCGIIFTFLCLNFYGSVGPNDENRLPYSLYFYGLRIREKKEEKDNRNKTDSVPIKIFLLLIVIHPLEQLKTHKVVS